MVNLKLLKLKTINTRIGIDVLKAYKATNQI